MGVFTFALKLLAMVAFAAAPQPWIHQPLQPARERLADGHDPRAAAAPGRTRWQSLPAVAPSPVDNPPTAAKVELGRLLFHDKNLSLTREVSCASCHDLEQRAGDDGRVLAQGIHAQTGRRNTPTVWNAAFQVRLFWDGRAASLEEQALGPITHPLEMGMPDAQAAVQRLAGDPAYPARFSAAFGPGGITVPRLVAALAAFERTLITPDTPYDRFVRGERSALTPLQVKGMALFESVGCVHCHAGPNFSGASVFDGSAPYRAFPARALADLAGLDLVADTGQAPRGSAAGVWRIPSLRNVAVTAPYFHNGSVADLKDAVRIMARVQLGLDIGDVHWLAVSPTDGSGPPALILQPGASLSESDVDALVAFLHALTSPRWAQPAPGDGGPAGPRTR
jgi:cytochrome c peroxidase